MGGGDCSCHLFILIKVEIQLEVLHIAQTEKIQITQSTLTELLNSNLNFR